MSSSAYMIDFVTIPGGSFRMGGVPEDKFVTAVELPRHSVLVKSFGMSVHPVTRGQWADAHDLIVDGNPDLPITGITFPEAEAFARGIGCRVPSEAEWEYACRAGSCTIFPNGGQLHPQDANFLYDECGDPVGRGAPAPVGSHAPNGFGLHDMIGNVCEWTTDLWHPTYQSAPADGSPWMAGGKTGCRVIRGGAWDQLPRVLRASWRDWAPESAPWDNLGFRLARDLPS